jgi:Amt family ammonium transporter
MPCAIGGLALINAGLARSRNVSHSLLGALCVLAAAAAAYFVVGGALQGFGTGGRVLMLDGKAWGWIGAGRLFLGDLESAGTAGSLRLVFGLFAVIVAAVIPLGAGAERWRIGASCASAAVLAGVTYPVFAHWAWGGGWLAQLGVNCNLGRGFLDAGGSGCIQAVGGLSALAAAWILGPRGGKFQAGGMPAAMPAHNAPFVLFGCVLAWLGWLGIDCAGAILFTGIDIARVSLVPVNATLAAGAALLAATGITRARFGKPDASLCANGWVAGLVASSAGCASVSPMSAALIGLIAGGLAVFSIDWFERRWKLDDPAGAISVHGAGGLWGLFAAGLLVAPSPANQLVAQAVGVATLIGFVLPLAYASNWLLNRILPQRAPLEWERQGLDLHELGAGAYPDFMTHGED